MKFDTKSRKRLLEWMQEHKISAYKFCHTINGTHPNVFLWVKGKSRPSYKYAAAIQKVTEGFVTIDGWHELCQAAQEPEQPKHQPNRTTNDKHATKTKRTCEIRKRVA